MFLLVQNTKLIIQEQQQQQQNIVLHATPMQAGSGCRILSKKKKKKRPELFLCAACSLSLPREKENKIPSTRRIVKS